MVTAFIISGCVAISGIIGSAIASNRGQGIVGFFFGAFLGPVGWLLCALASDTRPKCPECRGIVVRGAKRCKNCGQPIRIIAKPITAGRVVGAFAFAGAVLASPFVFMWIVWLLRK